MPSSLPRALDVAVVGGGAAGLSAALVLGRARRDVLLVDAGAQSNRAAHGVGGLLGHDGRPPAELYARGRDELARYPSVTVVDGTVTGARRDGDGFTLTLDGAGADAVRARRVVLATGMAYVPPAVPGLPELWGGSVFHCPFCHGWEVRDRPLAVLGRTTMTAFQAGLLAGWSDDVVVLTDGPPAFDDDAREALARRGLRVDERPVRALRAADGALAAVVFADGSELPREGLMVHAPLRPRDDLATQLGLETTALGAVKVDGRGAASVPGVFAAGDGAETMAQVAAAAAAGALAGAMVAHELIVHALGIAPPDPDALPPVHELSVATGTMAGAT